MDEDARKAFDELGLDLERDNVEAVSKRLGLDMSRGLGWNWRKLVSQMPLTDPWDASADSFAKPFESPIPVEIVGDFDPDPIEFTLELSRPASQEEAASLSEWIARLGFEESRLDDDHVSSWSEAVASNLAVTGSPTLTWHFDAALAGPDRIRRTHRKDGRLCSGGTLAGDSPSCWPHRRGLIPSAAQGAWAGPAAQTVAQMTFPHAEWQQRRGGPSARYSSDPITSGRPARSAVIQSHEPSLFRCPRLGHLSEPQPVECATPPCPCVASAVGSHHLMGQCQDAGRSAAHPERRPKTSVAVATTPKARTATPEASREPSPRQAANPIDRSMATAKTIRPVLSHRAAPTATRPAAPKTTRANTPRIHASRLSKSGSGRYAPDSGSGTDPAPVNSRAASTTIATTKAAWATITTTFRLMIGAYTPVSVNPRPPVDRVVMPDRSRKRPRDLNALAKSIVDDATSGCV
jgi:hypothetical protein